MSPLRRLGRWWGGLWRDTHTLRPGCVPPIPDDAALFMGAADWSIIHTLKAEKEEALARLHQRRAREHRREASVYQTYFADPDLCQSCNDTLECGFERNPLCLTCPNNERNESK